MSELLSDERLAEIRARAEAATSGPWRKQGTNNLLCVTDGDGAYIVARFPNATLHGKNRDANAAFIAHARQDIPALLDHATTLAAEVAALRLLVTDLLSPEGDANEGMRRLYEAGAEAERARALEVLRKKAWALQHLVENTPSMSNTVREIYTARISALGDAAIAIEKGAAP